MRRKLLIVDPVHASIFDELSSKYDVTNRIWPDKSLLIDLCADAEGIILRSGVKLDREVIDSAKNLRVIVRAGNGMDNIDRGHAEAKGIQVFNVPGASKNAVAEHTFGLMLALARKIAWANHQMREGLWDKANLSGLELRRKTLGIVGLGSIGSAVASISMGFGMKVLACVRRPTSQRKEELGGRGITLTSLDTLVTESDVIALHVPLNESTKSMFSAAQFDAMKCGALLINMARGGVVDEKGLYTALVQGDIAGAASDVFVREREQLPLLDLPNFVATPHIGAMTEDAQMKIARTVVDQVNRVFY